ncbi:MAG: ArsC family reductase [Gammaproteobacteria bacterium]|jgi:Spx/MgsR family transcriptional regulator|nr:ArsC family reductase [Gammaproteobacteria bacterium]MBT3488249.1 ArsC family reductase [Gammaproteobacteria bacterium]MBT3719922.1 ArsC family reductase [Gammaproteobacteria bacterium]MBT3843838.1 ArsC family reductase [Gammaproteobacteria bacterium]MBT3894232.1 ArsC family reductase [Gammaproteobacteria bacterium]
MNILYGIPNCDTIRKAKKWLTANQIDFQFHDFRKSGLEQTTLQSWVMQVGSETLLNKRGTTWRQLPAEAKENIDESRTIELLLEHPAMIKRPVLVSKQLQRVEVGFSEARYQEIFS